MTEKNLVTLTEDLRSTLTRGGIALDAWGQGDAKTIEDLAHEIDAGESRVTVENGEALRVTSNVGVDVYHRGAQGFEVLIEDKQVKKGKVKRRNLGVSLAEKLIGGENRDDAIQRAIDEERPEFVGHLQDVQYKGVEITDQAGFSYPGLRSRYERHRYEAYLDDEAYKQEGYVTEEPDKITYFVWKKVG